MITVAHPLGALVPGMLVIGCAITHLEDITEGYFGV